jgi:hypothetical protein
MSGSASFHNPKKSLDAARLLSRSPWSAWARHQARRLAARRKLNLQIRFTVVPGLVVAQRQKVALLPFLNDGQPPEVGSRSRRPVTNLDSDWRNLHEQWRALHIETCSAHID